MSFKYLNHKLKMLSHQSSLHGPESFSLDSLLQFGRCESSCGLWCRPKRTQMKMWVCVCLQVNPGVVHLRKWRSAARMRQTSRGRRGWMFRSLSGTTCQERTQKCWCPPFFLWCIPHSPGPERILTPPTGLSSEGFNSGVCETQE